MLVCVCVCVCVCVVGEFVDGGPPPLWWDVGGKYWETGTKLVPPVCPRAWKYELSSLAAPASPLKKLHKCGIAPEIGRGVFQSQTYCASISRNYSSWLVAGWVVIGGERVSGRPLNL